LRVSPRHSAAEARRTWERILDRAVDVASVEGFEGLTIGRLAADLEMSKAGLLGRFGSKEALQRATLERALQTVYRTVWEPVADLPQGLTRLRAVCEHWIGYVVTSPFPGGCLLTTAAVEYDARPGPIHDMVVEAFLVWQRHLSDEVGHAVAAGELPATTDAEQVVFELIGIFMSLNQVVQLFGVTTAASRAERAVDRVLAW
jgi:AcrR family transcriptional regulator